MKELPDIDKNFSDWYNEVVFRSGLCDQAPVKGCIIIKPYGQSIWELMQKDINSFIKDMNVSNVSFPMLIPEKFIQAEADHVEGFAPELAIVTHAGGKDLEENFIIRPTSETIIHSMFSRWIKSWRDLPIKINQWCSVIRWEKRPRPFIRTTEFWWQEGHTGHETAEEAYGQAYEAHSKYREYIKQWLMIPFVYGEKANFEKFAGASLTLTVEGMMRDGKALQLATSHLLNDTFSKAFNIYFENKKQERKLVHLTSWGCTTRLIGAVVMVHGDNKGLVLPSKVAPIQVIIIPIFKLSNEDLNANFILIAKKIKEILSKQGIRSEMNLSIECSVGEKFHRYEMEGVPLRIEFGERDISAGKVILYNRSNGKKELYSKENLLDGNIDFNKILFHYDSQLYENAEIRMRNKIIQTEELLSIFGLELLKKSIFYETGWCGDDSLEVKLKEYKATVRCILSSKNKINCCLHGKICKSLYDIIIARAY